MKFSNVLGAFALSTLEASRAFASPVEAQSLEGRATDEVSGDNGDSKTAYVAATGGKVLAFKYPNGCQVFLLQDGARPPSQGGCRDWRVVFDKCPTGKVPAVTGEESEVCQNFKRI
ncbi:hypothetical protein E4U09_008201 [Claviceps aff. purpurea]|uniref:Uncharacterized protein n=1 Tax=Claviceps aff. purpurea TaxID=1967640 RepID=A0A9P7QLA5_9HYPO|nr:hypothetical protein E4U09_008201 [Claviceps aff. purpurea]